MKKIIGASVEPTYVDPRAGDVRDSQADIRKARAVLDYEPIVSFEEGLERTIEWYRNALSATPA
jgi:nucleoside-diphosphate-sugar epimerase